MKRKALVVANWKMHGQRLWIEAFVQDFLKLHADHLDEHVSVVICPPAVYLLQFETVLQNSEIKLGAQNVSNEPKGAFTGEVSAAMLQDAGCSYVLVGHSERRTLFAETDAVVAAKYLAVTGFAGLTPILCVGESAEQRQAGRTETVIAQQLDAVLRNYGAASLQEGVIAYEPVWAIGTGNTATPAQAQAVHAFIRGHIASYDAEVAQGLTLLYGGSVKADNADALAKQPDIDGVLVGGASLVVSEFAAICAKFAAD
jgi:triosephosphate isomerase (TIM)